MTATIALTTQMPMLTVALLIIIGLAYIGFSTLVQRKIGNPKRMRDIQKRMNELSKDLNRMIKEHAAQEEISKKQSELMPLMSENMKVSMKPMLVILPIFFALYYLALPAIFAPMAHEYVLFLSMKLNYAGVFFACVFIVGIITSIIILVYDRVKAKKETSQTNQQAQLESQTNK